MNIVDEEEVYFDNKTVLDNGFLSGFVGGMDEEIDKCISIQEINMEVNKNEFFTHNIPQDTS